MAAISQTTFSNAFSWMKFHGFRLIFHWSLFLRFELRIFQHWFRWWLGANQATSHYLNQLLSTHMIRVTWVCVINMFTFTGIILCMCPANERWCYNVTSSLIGWAHISALVQERRNSSVLSMELCLSCTNPSIYKVIPGFIETCFQLWQKNIMHRTLIRADSRFEPSQWQTTLICNDDSHWLWSKPWVTKTQQNVAKHESCCIFLVMYDTLWGHCQGISVYRMADGIFIIRIR